MTNKKQCRASKRSRATVPHEELVPGTTLTLTGSINELTTSRWTANVGSRSFNTWTMN